MSPGPKTPISKDELVRTNVAMLVLTSLFVLSRAALQFWNRKPFELPDFFIYFAFVMFVAILSFYFCVIPPMFRVYDILDGVMAGLVKPYDGFVEDSAAITRLLISAQLIFYTILYSVKMSLLTLYRKLLTGLHGAYRKFWWGLLIFCVLAWISSGLSALFSCEDVRKQFTEGVCGVSALNDRNSIASLYFTYGMDVLTDFAIMFLPIHLTWRLQMPIKQKIGIFILFGSGLVCILFATLRVVQLGVDDRGKATTPEPKWMVFWTVLECAMAVLIGCSPAFSSLIRKHIKTSKSSYNAHDYHRQDPDDIRLKNRASCMGRPKHEGPGMYWQDTNSSQEELAKNVGRIVVRTTLHQNDEIASSSTKHNSTSGSWAVEAHNGNGKFSSSSVRC